MAAHREGTHGDEDRAVLGRPHVRRIVVAFMIVILLTPLVALGGRWSVLLFVQLGTAAWAGLHAVRLRRIARGG